MTPAVFRVHRPSASHQCARAAGAPSADGFGAFDERLMLLSDSLKIFYERYAPAKAAKAMKVARRNRDNLDGLNQQLYKKYGADLTSVPLYDIYFSARSQDGGPSGINSHLPADRGHEL